MTQTNFRDWEARFNSLVPSTQSVVADALLSRTLELYINPTEHCNFRCAYCYEDFAIGRMSPAVVARVKKLLGRSAPGFKSVYLHWFGGEPLLAKSVVLEISNHAFQVCASSGVNLSGGVTTNGYLLTLDLVKQLAQCNQSLFQVSFDGDEQAHNTVRRRADGAGTFAKIWDNLCNLKETNLEFNILMRVHVRPNNEESIAMLLERIGSTFNGDGRFAVGFHKLSDLGGPKTGTFSVFSQAEYEDVTSRLLHTYNERFKIKRLEDDKSDEKMVCGLGVCYAAKPHAFYIRADGRLCKCTVAMDKDYNTIGSLTDAGELRLNDRMHRKWTDGMLTLDPIHLSCPFVRGDKYFTEE